MPEHGGNRLQASREYGIPPEQWLDLSTGINPNGWPVPSIPEACWQRLPEDNDGLIEAAALYYQVKGQFILPVAGTQAVIQNLPGLRPTTQVAIVEPAYNEHRHNWERLGHKVIGITVDNIEKILPEINTLILINPGNPTSETISPERILSWHKHLKDRNGWLIVDEAYMDSSPECSIASEAGAEGLFILRSLGKFFGLAGIRVGFLLAEERFLSLMAEELGPWHLANPSRWIARQALLDTEWQRNNRLQLSQQRERLNQLLQQAGFISQTGYLFSWFIHPQANDLYKQLAQQGILVRYFPETSSIRIGLPGNHTEWQRLEQGLKRLTK